MRSIIAELLLFLAMAVLHVYRLGISPLIHLLAGPGYGCRFQPGCSSYAQEALKQHGLIKGGSLALRRVSRCHPFSRTGAGSGYDPVPLSCICHRPMVSGSHPICRLNESE